MKTRAQVIASLLVAIDNCKKSGNMEWLQRHTANLSSILESAPYGSGFDNGTSFDWSASRGDRLVFYTSFHHMDKNGYYDGWTEHRVTVSPHFVWGLDIRVSGRNRNDIKTYIDDVFREWLDETIEEI